jgi:hypothetical protein
MSAYECWNDRCLRYADYGGLARNVYREDSVLSCRDCGKPVHLAPAPVITAKLAFAVMSGALLGWAVGRSFGAALGGAFLSFCVAVDT